MTDFIYLNDDDLAEGADESRARTAAAKQRPNCNEFSYLMMRQIDGEADDGRWSTVVRVNESDVPCVDDAVEGLEDAGYSVDWDANSRRLFISWEN